jgi:hypothetical protein
MFGPRYHEGHGLTAGNVLKNVMPVAHFEMILQACAASDEFRSILPVLVLKGFAGCGVAKWSAKTLGRRTW